MLYDQCLRTSQMFRTISSNRIRVVHCPYIVHLICSQDMFGLIGLSMTRGICYNIVLLLENQLMQLLIRLGVVLALYWWYWKCLLLCQR